MEKNIFILMIEAAPHAALLTRLTSLLNRSRIQVDDLHATAGQPILIRVTDTRENIRKISLKMRMQVDVLSVKFFEECMIQRSPAHE